MPNFCSRSSTAGDIVCNIGDLLMLWPDDRFKTMFHRVRAPMDPETDYYEPRYSIAFFDQSCECLLMVSIGQSVSKLTT